MNVIDLPLSQIKPYEKNPRDNSRAVEYVRKSIEEFGWQQPIVVDKDYVIIVGHTRFKAAQEMGCTTVPVIVADTLSEAQVKAYRLADNKTSDFSIWDNKLLLEELQELGELDEDIFTGFDWGELFDNVLDESDDTAVEDNETGVMYEITFKSNTKEKIDEIISLWEKLGDAYEE